MASAGRILIMPKGAYSASATYETLDMVSHNGTTWLAKKTVKGIEPSSSNSEHWQNMFNMSASDYLNLSGGTLKGNLGLGSGSGTLGSNTYGAYLESRTDDKNYRGIKIDSQSYKENISASLKLVNCVNGEVTEYSLFGNHNKETLKPYIEQVIADYLKNNS